MSAVALTVAVSNRKTPLNAWINLAAGILVNRCAAAVQDDPKKWVRKQARPAVTRGPRSLFIDS